MRRFTLLFAAPVLVVLAIQVLPLITGARTLYLRDVMTSHLPLEAAQAHLLRDGHLLPIADPFRSGGQPLLGNPNALPLYPTKLLYAFAPILWALNAHFWIHWCIAPLAGFWLGRAWGLHRPGAWFVGTAYAFSGYFLSQLNLYNLVAGTAWTPALIAAGLDAAERSRDPACPPRDRRRSWVLVGTIWGLIVAGGDPLIALLAGLLTLSAIVARAGWRSGGGSHWLAGFAAAISLGTLMVSPMLVEMARILPVSHRAAVPASPASTLAQSVQPSTVVEWFLPLAFGDVDQGFWGKAFYGGYPPLFYSLAPGALVLALLWVAGIRRSRTTRWAWSWIGLGGFVALGWSNPVIRGLVETFDLSLLRYPVKVWLVVAVGGALASGVGFEQALETGGRRLARCLAVLTTSYVVLWITLVRLPPSLVDWLRAQDPRLAGPFFAVEHGRWLSTATLLVASSVALWLGAVLLRSRPTAAAVLLIVVHVGSQANLLASLVATDRTDVYRPAAAVIDAVPPSARVAHGAFGRLFGEIQADVQRVFPDLRFQWQTREDVASMGPGGGILHSRRYALNRSPERLDTYPSALVGQVMTQLDDHRRIRLLEIDGVDRLIMPRPLQGVGAEHARLIARLAPSPDGPIRAYDLHVYALDQAVPAFRLVGRTVRSGNFRSAVQTLFSDEHDPMTTALLPLADGAMEGAGDPDGPPGTVEIVRDDLESIHLVVDSAAGGVVVSRRAWLPVWRAAMDGEAVEAELVDLHKLGVRVPPGRHAVKLWIDRRPTRAACGLALLAAALLLVAFFDRRQ